MKKHTLSCTVSSLLWGRDKEGNIARKSLPYQIDNFFETLEEAIEVFGDESTVVDRFRSKEDAHGPKGDARRAYYAELAKFEELAKGFRPGYEIDDQLSFYATPEDEREEKFEELSQADAIDLFVVSGERAGKEKGSPYSEDALVAQGYLAEVNEALDAHILDVFGKNGPSTHFGVTITISKDLLEGVKGFVNAQLTGEGAEKAYEGVLKGCQARGYARLARIFPELPEDAGENDQFITEFARWKKFRDDWEEANKKAEDLLADMS